MLYSFVFLLGLLLPLFALTLGCLTDDTVQVDPPEFTPVIKRIIRAHGNDPRKLQQQLSKALPGQRVVIDVRNGLRIILRPVLIKRIDVKVNGGPYGFEQKVRKFLEMIQQTDRPCCDLGGVEALKQDVISTLQSMGYKDVKVSYQVKSGVLEFHINTGQQSTITRLLLSSDIKNAQVSRSVSQIVYGPWWWLPWRWKLDKYQLERKRRDVAKELKDLGYFDALVMCDISADNIVTYVVIAGSQYRFASIDWRGPWPNKVRRAVQIKRGTPLTCALYTYICSALNRRLREHGASVVPNLQLDRSAKTATVVCTFHEACAAQIDNIVIDNNKKTYYPLPIYRILGVYPGDVLTPSAMQMLRKRCMVQFQDVKILDLGPEIRLEVEEHDQGYDHIALCATASYNIIDGGDLEFACRYKDLNLLGQGDKFQAKLGISDTARYVMIESQRPYLGGTETSLAWSVYARDTNTRRLLRDLFGAGGDIHYQSPTSQVGGHLGFVRPISATVDAELYFQSRFENYGLSPMGMRYTAAQEALGLIRSSRLNLELQQLPYMIAQCHTHGPLRNQIETIINKMTGENDLHAAAIQLRMILDRSINAPLFGPAAFPTCIQSLYSIGVQFVDHDLDRLSNPTNGYRATYNFSLHTTLTTIFAKILLTLECYKQILGQDVMCKLQAGKMLGSTYWVNNFTIVDFPCRLINHSPVAEGAYAVGGRSGFATTLSTKLFTTKLWYLSAFLDVVGLWDAGLTNVVVQDKPELNGTPGLALTIVTPGLPPIELCAGIPMSSGRAVPSSLFSACGVYFSVTMGM
jgi:outer membrane protein assembly factor BamA